MNDETSGIWSNYLYSILCISCKRKEGTYAVEASRWPMLNPMTTEQRIAELQTSVRYSRTSVSRGA